MQPPPEFFFNDIWRMDWGFGNPNKTAALIAMLMVAVWSIAYLWRKGFWLSVVLFTGLAICLVHTFSRGGLIACFVGLVPLLLAAPRPWPWIRTVAVLSSVWIAIGLSVYLQAHERYTKGIAEQDRAITNRLDIWKAAPGMIKDAPQGWGIGNAGRAYMDWYQPLDRTEQYRTLVNSHLTWLVELGWGGRFIYLFGWLMILLICWPIQNIGWLSIPFGIWLSLLVAAIFSSVAESPWLWVLPGISFVLVLGWRYRKHRWPASWLWSAPPVLAAILVAIAYLSFPQSKICRTGGVVIVNQEMPSLWIAVDREILGKQYARVLRNAVPDLTNLTLGIVEEIEDLPKGPVNHVILSGRFTSGDALRCLHGSVERLTLVNPIGNPQDALQSSIDYRELNIFIGEFSQTSSAAAWAQTGKNRSLPGIGDFIPDWPQHLLPND